MAAWMRKKWKTSSRRYAESLLCFPLVCNRFFRLFYGFGISEIRAANRLQRIVEFIDERNARGNNQLHNRLIGNIVEIFYQRPQTIPVGGDDDLLSGFDGRRNRLMPCRQESCNRILQTFCEWNLLRCQAAIAGIVSRASLIVIFERRRLNIITAAPDMNLLFPKFRGSLRFV